MKVGKGWYGNSVKHSLASKGIKSKVKQYKAKGIYNYYEQLYPLVMEYLEDDYGDFGKWDKKDLEEKDINEFMLFVRKRGTHLEIIDMEYNEHKTPEQRLSNADYYPSERSEYKKVFYGKDGEVVEITKEEAEEILEKRVLETEKERKVPITDFPKVENYEVFEDAVKEIDQRQYYGLRTLNVIPKRRYTYGFWSNSDASWHFREQVFNEDTTQLDANEILLPYGIDQVLGVSYALPPLPLYSLSFEARQSMGTEEQQNITEQWALKRLESKVHDENASDYERMSAQVMLTKAKQEFGIEPAKDKREELL